MSNYFHEAKIGSDDFRRSLANHPAYMSAFFRKVHAWANDESIDNPMCKLNELGGENNCHDFAKYTLDKAVKFMQDNYGQFDESTYQRDWSLRNVQSTRYAHSPLSDVPILGRIFSYNTPQPGSKRTPNVAISWGNAKPWLEGVVLGGSVLRMVSDLADQGQVQMVFDYGTEQTNPWASEYSVAIN